MTDEPTVGELRRNYAELRQDVRSGFSSINSRLDEMPTQNLLNATLLQWAVRLETQADDISELKTQRAKDQEMQQAARDRDKRDRQWLIGVVLIPIALSVLSLILIIGGGPQ